MEKHRTNKLNKQRKRRVDPKGNIRYIEIININNNTVTVNTRTKTKEYKLDEFQNIFTGITIQTPTNPQTVLER